MTAEFHPGLVQLAEQLATTPDVATDRHGRSYTIERCPECSGAIIPPDVPGRLGHLLLEHGWRMDGKRYNRNELVEVL